MCRQYTTLGVLGDGIHIHNVSGDKEADDKRSYFRAESERLLEGGNDTTWCGARKSGVENQYTREDGIIPPYPSAPVLCVTKS